MNEQRILSALRALAEYTPKTPEAAEQNMARAARMLSAAVQEVKTPLRTAITKTADRVQL